MGYTLTQAQAFLDADGQLERQQLAQLLGVVAGHRPGDVMAYTLWGAQAFLDADGQIERQQLAQLLGIHAVAAQGEKRGIEQLQRDLLKD